jgi:hypothetical protein
MLSATPGVQRNHQIGRRSIVCIGDADLMTELAQDASSTAHGGVAHRDDERAGVIMTMRMNEKLVPDR